MFWLHVFLCTHVGSAIKSPKIGVIGVCEHRIWSPCKGNQFLTGKPLELKRNESVFACVSYPGAYRSQKSLGYLGLELQLGASCHLGAGNWTCSCREYSLRTDPWLQSPNLEPLRTNVTFGLCGSESVYRFVTLVSLTSGLFQCRKVLRRLQCQKAGEGEICLSQSCWQASHRMLA